MAYRKRLERDLDRWIAAGHVSAEKRAPMLAMVEEPRRLDASTALAYVGAALLGLAIIAFVAANWDGLPRLIRFALVLALFAGAVCGAAWASARGRPGLSNGLATLAALIFAAAVGLVGQIFDIAGDPARALIGSGIAAALLSFAGRSTGAGIAALLLIALGDMQDGREALWWTFAAALPAAVAAWSWRSGALAHAASLALVVSTAWICARAEGSVGWFLLAMAIAGGLAALARWRADESDVFPTFYGWAVWGALAFLVGAGLERFDTGPEMIPHRLAWLAAAGGAIALGRHDRHAMVTAGGVIFLIGAVMALLADLGVDLMTAAAVFLVCALAALVGGLLLRRAGQSRA
jgi:hypothetical protein